MTEVRLVRLGRIVASERQVAIRIRNGQAAKLRKNHCLNHRESLAGAILKILVHLFLIEPVNEFPGSVTQVEEGRAVFVLKIMAVVGDFQPPANRSEPSHAGRKPYCKKRRENLR